MNGYERIAKRLVSTASAACLVGLACAACGGSDGADTRPWKLVWSDEFESTDLDATKWSVETGSAFGTGQDDFDTARPENISFANGSLVITARSEAYSGASYTSGRISTAGKAEQQYGRFEARIQLPHGQGMWPAFWLLGNDYQTNGWPKCGEIDVMENKGADTATVLGSMHAPGGADYSQTFRLQGTTFTDDFHVFAIEWEAGTIRWYVDGALYETRSADTLPRNQTWVFDHPFFVILDLAIGGQFGGDVDSSTPFPQAMLVDYVRVYARGDG